MKKISLIIIGVILLLVAGCNGNDGGNEKADRNDHKDEIPADTTPPVISSVLVSDITSTSAVVSWTTDEQSTSQVEYGTTISYGSSSVLDDTKATSHSISLTKLAAGTTYHYKVISTDASGNTAVSEDHAFTTASPPIVPTGDLWVHFIDVGQGDAILIDYGTYEMLIDGGRYGTCAAYIPSYVDGALEVIVATHPDADHIGGLIDVLDDFVVEEIWLNGDTATSQTYTNFMNKVNAEGAQIHEARRADQITLNTLVFDVLHPIEPLNPSDRNENSIVLDLVFGQVDFLFTGDVEEGGEDSMVAASFIRDIDILKVSHHGSKYCSTADFLAAAQAEVAIYSAGSNPYGHPTQEAITRLYNAGATIYGTDVHGTVKVTTDGTTYDVELTNQVAPVTPSGIGDTTPPLISSIADLGVTDSGAIISWTTDEVATSQVEYGTDTSYGTLTTLDASLTTLHNVALTGLNSSTIYHYRVRSKDASGNEAVSDDHSFTTNATPSPGGVTITDIDLSGEVVTIVNNGSSVVDMTGWRLVSVTGNQTYTFPSFTLAAGATVLIVSGPGSVDNPPAQLRWSGAYIWNNDGDSGELYDASNNLVSSHPGI